MPYYVRNTDFDRDFFSGRGGGDRLKYVSRVTFCSSNGKAAFKRDLSVKTKKPHVTIPHYKYLISLKTRK